ncbi:hypothetical protein [Phenylobacterium sp.]|nr:hypothetical protein [Phenylobacterium sp.]
MPRPEPVSDSSRPWPWRTIAGSLAALLRTIGTAQLMLYGVGSMLGAGV